MSSKRPALAQHDTSKTATAFAVNPGAAPQDLWLRVAGAGSLDTHLIRAGRVVVLGRGSKADIDLGDVSVSRRHALIYNNDTQPQIADMRSGNGTWIGERQLDPQEIVPAPLGSEIRIGNVKLYLIPAPPEALEKREPGAQGPTDIVVASPRMQEIYDLAGRVAQSDISVLILGETGTGKEVLAASIHRRSPRAAKPFVCLNCGAFTESLLESELFGHERGAFTGAVQTKVGLLESAQGGTVFLDEVGEMPPALQIKLLRVLEERKINRIGELKPRQIDVRFLAATHRDLTQEVARGAFRQDLFFRINGISLTIPPLRERIVEVSDLAHHFLASAAQRAGLRRLPRLSPDALALLEAHDWPGNIRELRNIIDRALVLCAGDVINVGHLRLDNMRTLLTPTMPPPPRAPPSMPSIPSMPSMPSIPSMPSMPSTSSTPPSGGDDERRRIMEALEQCAGNQTYAAERLGISRSTLVARIKLYDIPRPRRPR